MHFIYFLKLTLLKLTSLFYQLCSLKTDITEIDIALSINHAHQKLTLLKLTSLFYLLLILFCFIAAMLQAARRC